MRHVLLIISILTSAGCAMGGDDVTPPVPTAPPAEVSLAAELSRGATLHFDQDAAELSVATRFARSAGETRATALALQGGQASVVVMPDGSVVLQDLQLNLADIVGNLPESPIRFTQIEVQLGAAVHADAQWFGGDNEGYAEFSAELVIEWSLDRAGVVWPLEPLILRDVPIQVAMTRATNGTPTVEIASSIHGVFYDWVGIAQLSALEMRLESTLINVD